MSRREYYINELNYLREMGREFSRAHPEAARFLGEAGGDPDVERLLEGTAFLTASIRERLDNEEPHLVKGMLDLFMPAVLRPIPAVTTLQMDYAGGATLEPLVVPRGTEVQSEEIEKISCRFRTVYDVPMVPLRAFDVAIERGSQPRLHVEFNVLDETDFANWQIPRMVLHFPGDPAVAQNLQFLFLELTKSIDFELVTSEADRRKVSIQPDQIRAVGLGPDDLLIDDGDDSFAGHGHVLEYWHHPEKYLYVEVGDLEKLKRLGEGSRLRMTLELRRLPDGLPQLSASDFALNCTPAVNLFSMDAKPVHLDPLAVRYPLKPEAEYPESFSIHKVEEVSARLRDGSGQRVYSPLFKRLGQAGHEDFFYHASSEASLTGDGLQWRLSLAGADMIELLDQVDTLSISLSCSNGRIPMKLGSGFEGVVLGDPGQFAMAKALTRPTAEIPPPPDDDLYWRFLGQAALNFRSLESVSNLRQALRLYHFGALTDREAERRLLLVLDSITAVDMRTSRRLFGGVLVNGVDVEIELTEDGFPCEGGLYLLGAVLSEFFAHLVSLNTYSRLTIRGHRSRETYTWPARIGRRTAL